MQLAIVYQAASAAAISALFCAAPADAARGETATGAHGITAGAPSTALGAPSTALGAHSTVPGAHGSAPGADGSAPGAESTARERAPRDDGALLVLPGEPTQAGQIVITEFMKDPSTVTDARGEWIEVWNAMPWRVNLEGWILSDDSGAQHVIHAASGALRLGPGQYVVLGNNADPALNGGVQVDYAWSSFSLGNGADQIILSKGDGTLVDRVAYDDGVLWPDTAGRAIALRNTARTATLNDDPANWCHASTPIGPTNTDTGTPRMDNDACL